MNIDFREIQIVQKDFVKFLEERPSMINVKSKFGVTRVQTLAILSEVFEVLNETKIHKWWDLTPRSDKKVLEELSDVLSHICNVANQLEIKLVITEEIKQIETLESQFIKITGSIIQLPFIKIFFAKKKIQTIFMQYMQLVYALGFTTEELENAYYDKLEANYRRFK